MNEEANIFQKLIRYFRRPPEGLSAWLMKDSTDVQKFPVFPVYPVTAEKLKWDKDIGVTYLGPDARASYEISVKDGLLYDANGNVFDTTDGWAIWKKRGWGIYVMDQDGTVYSYAHIKPRFQHSSFFGGAPVSAAGELRVVNGRLKEISNWSGHYEPPSETISRVMEALARQGVDVSDVITTEWPAI